MLLSDLDIVYLLDMVALLMDYLECKWSSTVTLQSNIRARNRKISSRRRMPDI